MIMEAEKSHDWLSAGWTPKEVCGLGLVGVQRPENQDQ